MSEGGHPAVGADSVAASESPLPAGYGSLDAGFPAADPEDLERRRSARTNVDGPFDSLAGPPAPGPARPWARRRPPAVPSALTPAGPDLRDPAVREPVVREPAVREPVVREPVVREPVVREPVVRDAGAEADVVEGPVRGSRRPHQKVRLVRGVRSKRLIRRLDVWTVFKVSCIFYLLALVVLVVAGVLVWNVASALDFIHSIEKSVRTLFSLKTFTLHPDATFEYGTGIGALLCVVGVVVNVLATVTYNLISDLVGGIQVVVVTETD